VTRVNSGEHCLTNVRSARDVLVPNAMRPLINRQDTTLHVLHDIDETGCGGCGAEFSVELHCSCNGGHVSNQATSALGIAIKKREDCLPLEQSDVDIPPRCKICFK